MHTSKDGITFFPLPVALQERAAAFDEKYPWSKNSSFEQERQSQWVDLRLLRMMARLESSFFRESQPSALWYVLRIAMVKLVQPSWLRRVLPYKTGINSETLISHDMKKFSGEHVQLPEFILEEVGYMLVTALVYLDQDTTLQVQTKSQLMVHHSTRGLGIGWFLLLERLHLHHMFASVAAAEFGKQVSGIKIHHQVADGSKDWWTSRAMQRLEKSGVPMKRSLGKTEAGFTMPVFGVADLGNKDDSI